MPFDFKKFDVKCSSMTTEELQREWEHYTRLISGAATSTAVSGVAMPLTLGVSAIGVGLAAPAIHNARKKREIIERHMNRLGTSHNTRKRDVLGPMAISGTVGVVTLGVGSVGADAITNKAAEHGFATIVENEMMVKAGTHLALDAGAMAAEKEHMKNKKASDAFKADQQAIQFSAVHYGQPNYTQHAIQLSAVHYGQPNYALIASPALSPYPPGMSEKSDTYPEKSSGYSLAPMPAPPPYTPGASLQQPSASSQSYFPPQPTLAPSWTPNQSACFSPNQNTDPTPSQTPYTNPYPTPSQTPYTSASPAPTLSSFVSTSQSSDHLSASQTVISYTAHSPYQASPQWVDARSQSLPVPRQGQQVDSLSDQFQRMAVSQAPSPAPYQQGQKPSPAPYQPTQISSPAPHLCGQTLSPAPYQPSQPTQPTQPTHSQIYASPPLNFLQSPTSHSPVPFSPTPYTPHPQLQLQPQHPTTLYGPPNLPLPSIPTYDPSSSRAQPFPQTLPHHPYPTPEPTPVLTSIPTPQYERQQYFQSPVDAKFSGLPQQSFYPSPAQTPRSESGAGAETRTGGGAQMGLYFPPPPRVPDAVSR